VGDDGHPNGTVFSVDAHQDQTSDESINRNVSVLDGVHQSKHDRGSQIDSQPAIGIFFSTSSIIFR
jgi:hypothetical protein